MDYLEFFSLKDDPFRLTPDSQYFYPSREHNEILASLNYAIEQKEGFSLVVGEPGTGKTTILRILIDHWKEKADIALIMTPRLSPEEFLQAVLEDIHVKLKKVNKNTLLKTFRDLLVEHSQTGKRVIIIVDEAQNIPDETLEELRLLSNLETEKEKLLQIILIGQLELKKRLQADHLKQLNQRITIRATLRPLSKSETSDYIHFRLIKAGKGSVVFDDAAKREIFRFSTGIPRLTNLAASRAIMAAFVSGSTRITKYHVRDAVQHLSDTPPARKYLVYGGCGVLAVVLAFLIVFGIYKISGTSPKIATDNQLKNTRGSDVSLPKAAKVNIVKERPGEADTPAGPFEKSPAGKTQERKKEYPKAALPAPNLPAQKATEESERTVKVFAPSANMRSTPSINAEKVARAPQGAVFKVFDESRDETGRVWFKVMLADGRECWVSKRVAK